MSDIYRCPRCQAEYSTMPISGVCEYCSTKLTAAYPVPLVEILEPSPIPEKKQLPISQLALGIALLAYLVIGGFSYLAERNNPEGIRLLGYSFYIVFTLLKVLAPFIIIAAVVYFILKKVRSN